MKKLIPKLVGTYLNTLSLVSPEAAGRIGFNVFCTPQVPPVKPHHKEFLDTARQFNFKSDGSTLQAYQWGEGSKRILFLHGWQSHSFRWKKYIEAFPEDEYSIFAFDAPAHGLSEGKLVNIPIYSKAIQHFFNEAGGFDAVVSHSMGSFSVLHAIHHEPGLDLGKLILMGAPGEANEFVEFFKSLTGINDRTMGTILDYFKEQLDQTPDDFSAPRYAASVRVPGLIIHDEHDDEAPLHHAKRIHSAWPHSKLITTTGFGHNLRSPEVVAMVKDFVTGQKVEVH